MINHHIPAKNMANCFNKLPTIPKPNPIIPMSIKINPVNSTLYPLLLLSFFFFFFAIFITILIIT